MVERRTVQNWSLREKGQSNHKRKGSNMSQNKWAVDTGKAKKQKKTN